MLELRNWMIEEGIDFTYAPEDEYTFGCICNEKFSVIWDSEDFVYYICDKSGKYPAYFEFQYVESIMQYIKGMI